MIISACPVGHVLQKRILVNSYIVIIWVAYNKVNIHGLYKISLS